MANSVLLISILVALAEALRINPDSGGVPMSLYEAPKTRSGRRRSGATLPSFILTSRPFIASEVDGGDEYFQGSKKPVWDELPPNSQVLDCAPGRPCSHVVDVVEEYGDEDAVIDRLDTGAGGGGPSDYITNEIREKFDYYYGKYHQDHDSGGGHQEDWWLDSNLYVPATAAPTTATTTPSTTTTTTTMTTTRPSKYSVKDDKYWWQKKEKRTTTQEPARDRWDKWDTWEGTFENSRLPTNYDKFGFGAPELSLGSTGRSTSRPYNSESAASSSSSSATEYDPFSYHSNRKSKMRTGFKKRPDLRTSFSHRSDSRMSVRMPEYMSVAERRSDGGGRLPLPEYGPSQRMAYSGHPGFAGDQMHVSGGNMPTSPSGGYFYYPETFRSASAPASAVAPWHLSSSHASEPWRFKGMSYYDRYGWQQPNHLRRTEIPVWTSIELEKPQWNRKRRR